MSWETTQVSWIVLAINDIFFTLNPNGSLMSKYNIFLDMRYSLLNNT